MKYERRIVIFKNARFVLRHEQNANYWDIEIVYLYAGQKELYKTDSKNLIDIEIIGNIHDNR